MLSYSNDFTAPPATGGTGNASIPFGDIPLSTMPLRSNVPPTYQEALPASNASTAGVMFSVNAPGIQSGVSSLNGFRERDTFGRRKRHDRVCALFTYVVLRS